MNLLLDECMPWDLSKSFTEHTCSTVAKAGFAGKKNGELLTLAEQAGFDVLVTVDRGLLYQQNFGTRKLAVLIVQARSNRLKDLFPYVPPCLEALRSLQAGQIGRVGAPFV